MGPKPIWHRSSSTKRQLLYPVLNTSRLEVVLILSNAQRGFSEQHQLAQTQEAYCQTFRPGGGGQDTAEEASASPTCLQNLPCPILFSPALLPSSKTSPFPLHNPLCCSVLVLSLPVAGGLTAVSTGLPASTAYFLGGFMAHLQNPRLALLPLGQYWVGLLVVFIKDYATILFLFGGGKFGKFFLPIFFHQLAVSILNFWAGSISCS